jgi:hypothetical protein
MTVTSAALSRRGGRADGGPGTQAADERLIVRETGPALFNPPTAAFDLLRRYRYELTRTWDGDAPPWVFCMLNPSKAGALTGDLTISRCCGFAQAGGAGGIVAVNLFAYIATDPADLARQADPVGELNDAFIREACTAPGRMIIAAWGAHGSLRGRVAEVTAMLEEAGVVLHCLGVTTAGHPRHPSRLAAAARPAPYVPLRG